MRNTFQRHTEEKAVEMKGTRKDKLKKVEHMGLLGVNWPLVNKAGQLKANVVSEEEKVARSGVGGDWGS